MCGIEQQFGQNKNRFNDVTDGKSCSKQSCGEQVASSAIEMMKQTNHVPEEDNFSEHREHASVAKETESTLITDHDSTTSADWSTSELSRRSSKQHATPQIRTELYKKYKRRFQMSGYRMCVLWMLIISSTFLLLTLFDCPFLKAMSKDHCYYNLTLLSLRPCALQNPEKLRLSEDRCQLVICIVAPVVLLKVSLACSHVRQLAALNQRRTLTVLSAVAWLIQMFIFWTSAHFGIRIRTSIDSVPLIIMFIYMTHVLLPFPPKISIVLGAVTGFFGVALDLFEHFMPSCQFAADRGQVCEQLVCNVLIYLTVNIMAAYRRSCIDSSHKSVFFRAVELVEHNLEQQTKCSIQDDLLHRLIPECQRHEIRQLIIKYSQCQQEAKTIDEDISEPLVSYPSFITNGCKIRKEFERLIEDRADVSILFADIVDFTPLTARYLESPDKLVDILNEIFGHFDRLAIKNKCHRIKILGDCYICVAGFPYADQCHAVNCVTMGLHLLSSLSAFREKTGIKTLNMRVGIHSGQVFCGVMGLCRWQFDVWGPDVQLANSMESTGRAGYVHITESTKLLIQHIYSVESADPLDDNTLHLDNHTKAYCAPIATYFVVNDSASLSRLADHCSCVSTPFSNLAKNVVGRQSRDIILVNSIQHHFCLGSELPSLREWVHLVGKLFIQQTRQLVNGAKQERKDKETRSLDYLEENSDPQETDAEADEADFRDARSLLRCISLRFYNPVYEDLYSAGADPSFGSNFRICLLIHSVITIVQYIRSPDSAELVIVATANTMILLFTLVVFYARPCKTIRKLATGKKSQQTALFGMTLLLLTATSLVPYVSCEVMPKDEKLCFNTWSKPFDGWNKLKEGYCVYPSYGLFSTMLTLLSCGLFIKMDIWVKLATMILIVIIYSMTMFVLFPEVSTTYDEMHGFDKIVSLSLPARSIIYLLMLIFCICLSNWELEKNSRLNFIWRKLIERNRRKIEQNDAVTTTLMKQILPDHVIQHFFQFSDLTPSLMNASQSLYYKRHEDVFVLFASLQHFELPRYFSQEKIRCRLLLLNRIIHSFDQLLLTDEFSSIEKIKQMNTTLMLVTGLKEDAVGGFSMTKRYSDAATTVKFAKKLQEWLDLNLTLLRHSTCQTHDLYNVSLKIGVCMGPLVAGVIAADMPLYDVWGDTVNVASRMMSQGLEGFIQVPCHTAEVLMQVGALCFPRNPAVVDVKGKGVTRTFLSPLMPSSLAALVTKL